jgi:hypothetical protein
MTALNQISGRGRGIPRGCSDHAFSLSPEVLADIIALGNRSSRRQALKTYARITRVAGVYKKTSLPPANDPSASNASRRHKDSKAFT